MSHHKSKKTHKRRKPAGLLQAITKQRLRHGDNLRRHGKRLRRHENVVSDSALHLEPFPHEETGASHSEDAVVDELLNCLD